MKILGIETSCDETAIAIIDISGPKTRLRVKILSSIVLSQVPLHRKFGGVVPHLAKREHQRNLVPILLKALREAKLMESRIVNYELRDKKEGHNSEFIILNSILEREPELFARIREQILSLKPPKIDVIAVTVGPGLEPALWAGVNFARALSYMWKKPVIPVNHLEGHIYTAMLGARPMLKKRFHLISLKPPSLILIVSGGHTELVLMKKFGSYEIIGETRDDAAGEAFDKVARILGLGYPGGPEIEHEAEELLAKNLKLKVSFPRPMLHTTDFDFSFSGLKTAVLYFLQDAKKKYRLRALRREVAKEFQNAVVEVLVAKTLRAAQKLKVKSVILGGGVAANKKLRESLAEALQKELPHSILYLPHPKLTGDNALMIALAAHFQWASPASSRRAGYFSNKRAGQKKVRVVASLRLGQKM